jgi:hypothetical protein
MEIRIQKVRLGKISPGEVASERFAPERFGSIERFFPLHEFQGALATLMASWPPFLGARLPSFRYDLPHRWGRLNLLFVDHAAPERVSKNLAIASLRHHKVSWATCSLTSGRQVGPAV